MVGDIAVFLTTLLALLSLWAAIKEGWRRTLGRRGDLYRRLARLGVGGQLSFFEAVIGEPPAIKSTVGGTTLEEEGESVVERPKDFTQSFFVDRHFYLQTISDESETVQAFSVTTRHRRFTPTFTGLPKPGLSSRVWLWMRYRERAGYFFKVKLGRTTFSEIEGEPLFIRAWTAVRAAAYCEAHGGGNPSYYQTFVLTSSTAAGVAPGGPPLDLANALGHGDWSPGGDSEAPAEFKEIPGIEEFRREAVITTYSVLAMAPDMYPETSFGPHGDAGVPQLAGTRSPI
jgi:hypothetical protein